MGQNFAPELIRLLSAAGCFMVRHGKGDHDIWESPMPMVEHQRVDRRQPFHLWVLLAVTLAGRDDVAQQLQQGPVLRAALVLEQEVDVQGPAAAPAQPVDQVGAGRGNRGTSPVIRAVTTPRSRQSGCRNAAEARAYLLP